MNPLNLMTIPAFLLALFVFWRRLKDDYEGKLVFTGSIYVVLGAGVGYLASYLLPDWRFLLELAGAFSGLVVGVKLFRFRFYETLEALVIAFLYFAFVIETGKALFALSLIDAYLAFTLLALIGLYHFFDKEYQNFSWYASGRAGFAGLTVGALALAARVAGVFLLPDALFPGTAAEAIFTCILSFVLFLLVFNLSRSEK